MYVVRKQNRLHKFYRILLRQPFNFKQIRQWIIGQRHPKNGEKASFKLPPPRNFKNLSLYSSDNNLFGIVEFTNNKRGVKKILELSDDGKNIVYYRSNDHKRNCFHKICEKSDKILQEMETFIKNGISKLINKE